MITTVISYCSNDYKFIKKCIDSVVPFSDKVIVTVCNHYFNGEPEDENLITKTIAENENEKVKFLHFNYNKDKDVKYWHNFGRYHAIQHLSSISDKSDYILFLDADEVVDTKSFIKWSDAAIYNKYDAIVFECYWYYRDVCYRANTTEIAGLLIKKDKIKPDSIFTHYERWGMFNAISNGINHVVSLDNVPMVHHYSWVKTKDEMLIKTRNWGHNKEKNWTKLIEEEFSHEFNGTDFVHNYTYKKLEEEDKKS